MEELALDIWRGGRWQKAAHLRLGKWGLMP